MSVLIKDMGKPKSCYAVIDGESEFCPFVNTDDDCVILLKKGICEGTWEEQYSKCPLVEEPERKKGRWNQIISIPNDMYGRYYCSECGKEGNPFWYFCPTCGADMRGDNCEAD